MAHIHKDIDFAVEVFIVFGNKVLLRKHEKYAIWLGVGGHVELSEDPNQAALREVKEEVGLTVELWQKSVPGVSSDEAHRELISPVFMNRHRINHEHEHVAFVYFATSTSEEVIPEFETDVWKWCTKEELEDMKGDLLESVYVYAKTALEELSFKRM